MYRARVIPCLLLDGERLYVYVGSLGLFALSVPFAGLVAAIVLVLCIAQIGPLLALLPPIIWLYASGSPGRGTALEVVLRT